MRSSHEHDRRAVSAIARELAVVDLDGPSAIDVMVARVASILGTEHVCLYAVRCEDGEPRLERIAIAGGDLSPGRVRSGLADWVGAHRGLCGWSDFRSPAPSHRNVVVGAGSVARAADPARLPPAFSRLRLAPDQIDDRLRSARTLVPHARRWGIAEANQARALVCDGPACLAWFGAFQHEAFGRRALRILSALVHPVRRRLIAEDRISTADSRQLLPALLEEIATPAYLLDGKDRVVGANTSGRAALARDPARGSERLRQARRRGRDADITTVELASRGAPRHALLVERALEGVGRSMLDAARAHFALTARETEVVGHLARGHTNRVISVALGVSERTVETHVSRVLAKTDCGSRSAIVSTVWALSR